MKCSKHGTLCINSTCKLVNLVTSDTVENCIMGNISGSFFLPIWDTAKKCSCPLKVIGEKDNDGLIVYAFALYPTIDGYTDTYIVYI